MAEFKELGRVRVSDAREIIASQVIEDGEVKGINYNSYITSTRYTGYSKGGVFVPLDKMADFINLCLFIKEGG